MTTYHEASAMPFTDVLNRYQVLENRGTMSRAVATLQGGRRAGTTAGPGPGDDPPLAAAGHLEMLAVGAVIARHYRQVERPQRSEDERPGGTAR